MPREAASAFQQDQENIIEDGPMLQRTSNGEPRHDVRGDLVHLQLQKYPRSSLPSVEHSLHTNTPSICTRKTVEHHLSNFESSDLDAEKE